MPAITEAAFKKYGAIIALTAGMVAGGAVWATNVWASIGRLEEGQAAMRLEASEAAAVIAEATKQMVSEIRVLREAMIRAGTALPEPRGG